MLHAMSNAIPPQLPDDSKALFTLDLSADGGTETAGETFGRIIGGIALMIVGAALGLGSVLLFILSFFMPGIRDWFDLIEEFWWIGGAIGLGLAVFGFELVRRGRKRNKSAAEATFDTLAASGVIDAETVTLTDPGGADGFGTDNNPNRQLPPPPSIT